MKVELINYTPNAVDLLLRTKNTRLGFDSNPADWTEAQRTEHIGYMRDTIRSSWEFVDYVFEIRDVSRAFTHQLVRTRSNSYAQESQRTVDVRGHGVVEPEFRSAVGKLYWDRAVSSVLQSYASMVDAGEAVQDARGILPTNMETSIFVKTNLRTLADTAETRLCTRTQGEYQDAFRLMRAEVLKIHPWAEDFIQVHCVAHGTCAFPRYGKKECKFYDPRMDQSAVIADTRSKFWSEGKQVAIPIAVAGKTM